uniref:AT hook containing transcription factor 1 n=1 Tax=Oreochromis niloticus TaxID=8128 RepID=A0A669CXA6_ORENI
MHDLTAQVTSSLLPFSGVTVDALGEDEITLDSVLHGSFTVGRSGLAWLACGPHLEVVHAVTGERLSAYCFSGGGEHPPNVLAARDFSWLKRSGLLVGLEETEGSVLCLYDLGLSRVVKAVVIPGRITAIEPLVSYGGASTSTQHLHQGLRWFFGIAAVVTDLGHVLLVDLCLDDLSCNQSELDASDLQVVTKSPAEIPKLREVSTREGRHLCLQLNGPSGVGATALQYISRTNHLAVGFSDGYLQLWNMKTLKKEYHSQLEGGRVPVYAFTFQEPENDPRNCCYLWAVQSSQDLEGDVVTLRLLQLAFSERKCLTSGKILYEGLEYCEERYSQDLSGTAFPLRAQATNTRLLSCQTIEKFRPHPDRDDSMNEVASPDTSVSIFTWQVKAYGQGSLSTYIGVFDINRWYHAQMPDSLRTGESLQMCPYLAAWSLDPVVQMVSPHVFLDVVVHERSLSRGLPFTCPPPEQYFNPTTYNFDATCLLNSGIVHLTCSGYQKETLGFLKKAAPCSSDIISTSYSHCLMSGLLSSRLADTQPSSLSQEEQLDAILSTAVETSSLGLITGCIKQWTAEEQPGSALNLRYILDWAWNKVVQTKEELDGICSPLFDSSSNFTDPQTMQLLQHTQRLLSNLSAIFHCLLSEAQELTQKGLVGLMNKNMVSSLISKYAQVVLWFCRTGLLPEGSDDDALQISRPFYTHSVISNYYTIRREELTRLAKGKWCADCLMIDGLVGQCGERLTNLWKRDEGGTGQYPPPTLHALLDIYLLDNIDEAAKHAIVIYLLLDVMYSFPNKDGASVESFPTAFAIPIGLIKLVQGLWLLDHHDHQSSFELLLHPAASQFHFEWQHERVLQALMCQGQQSVALRYFHVTKPAVSNTSQAKLCLSVLLHNRCLIEAWYLLRQHSNRLNMTELLGFLYESCQELGLIKELLKLPLGLNEQECLEKFLQGTGGLQNRELLMVHYLQQANYIPALQLNHTLRMNLVNERDPKLKERSNTRNTILDLYGKVLPRVQRKLAMERAKPYQHPNTIHREVSRPQPLSTITKRTANEKIMSRAGFINNVLTKIEEVWLGKGASPQCSPANSPRAAEVPSSSSKPSSVGLPEPFLGTPITMTSKRKSRLIDLVVHPSCQTPRPLLSPPRPPSAWVSPKSVSKAPELCLLQTPQVVKRARALAASGPVFSAFTPQSILRSSLRPTPVATPSASPGRSITPPIRSKENRITFIEESESPEVEKAIRWTNGVRKKAHVEHTEPASTLFFICEVAANFGKLYTHFTSTVVLLILHSVVSVNDSEDLSSSGSEDEEDEDEEEVSDQEDEEEEEEEEEDSGSEVEIIEEVPGTEKLPSLQPSPSFVQQSHAHFLQTQAEQEAAVFSLITPGAEMKMVDEDIEGDVVMVRLGADDGMMDPDEAVEQGSSYMELKPSTTLLVPVELVEGQHGLVDGAQMDLPELRPTVVADESHGSFSLMLDVDEDVDKGTGILPMENNLQLCDPSTQYQVMDANEILAKPEVILLSTEDQDTPQSEEASQEDTREEIETVDGNYIDGTEIVQLQADFQTESTEANQESDDAKKQKAAELVMLTEDHESAAVSVSVPAPVEECLAAVEFLAQIEAADVAVEAKVKHNPAEEREEPEENGPSAETEPVMEEEELQDRKSSMEADEEKDEEIKTEKETQQMGEGSTRTDESVEEKPVKQALSLNSELDEEPVEEPTTSQRKKTPSTPTRRMTRGRMVTFISPLSEEANEPEDDRKMEDTKTSILVPTSPSRTPRKGKQAKETKVPASTPRRSTRKTQPELPKEEDEEVKVMDNNTSVASTSKASSPSRRSQRVAAARTSQRTQSGSEVSTAADDEVKHEEEVDVIKPSRRTSSKTPTPSKHTASQVKTPRRSSRRITSSTEVVATPLEIVKEEYEQDEVFASPVRRSSRRTKTETSETLSTVLEKVEDKEQLPSPGRTTQHSSQISLTVYPQVRIQKAIYNLKTSKNTCVHRSSRRKINYYYYYYYYYYCYCKLFNLYSCVCQLYLCIFFFNIYIWLALKGIIHHIDRFYFNRHFHPPRSKAVAAPLPIAEVELISPLPSPVDSMPRALRRIKEGEEPTTSRNLRRKRVLDTVFTKPVTRRKKL